MESKRIESAAFSAWAGGGRDLRQAAAIAVRQALRLRPGEKTLIIANPVADSSRIAMALYDAVAEAGALPSLIFQPVKSQLDFAEETVIAAFDALPDAFISISTIKLGKDREGIARPYEWQGVEYDHIFHYQLYGSKTLRAFWSPSATADMFVRTVPIDYEELAERCERVAAVLRKAATLRVTSPGGSDFTVGVAGRKARRDDGNFSAPGSGGNLPAGETFVSPVVGSSEGRIVFDGSIATHEGDVVISAPIAVAVEGGYVISVEGGEEARAVLASIAKAETDALEFEAAGKLPAGKGRVYARNARNIGEFGIGLNPKARVSGNMLEDEKAFRTCHVAIGHNYDEDAPALIHLDGLIREPTIVAILSDGGKVTIEEAGELVL